MVKYKCWTCRTDIESPESKVGQREICSHCGTPSAVPKPLELELNTGNELCYYCEQRKANPHFTELVPVGRWIEHPYFFCLDCSSEWQELEDTNQNAPKEDYSDTESSNEWVPRCTSASAQTLVQPGCRQYLRGSITQISSISRRASF